MAGGDAPSPALLKTRGSECDLILAADRGLEPLLSAGLQPDLVVGDLDSLDSSVRREAERLGLEIAAFPPEKDSTDLELTVEAAVKKGAGEIILLGATGGRMDHFLGNLAILTWCLEAGIRAFMEDDLQTIAVFSGHFELTGRPGDTVSLIPAGEKAVVCSTGLHYPLEHLLLTNTSARGVSNVFCSGRATLSTTAPLFVIRPKTV